MPNLATLIDELVVANHILYHHGVVDGLGHISVRHPERADRFLLSCNRAPGQVAASDIQEYELDGTPVDPDSPRPYLERFIHGEIFRSRSDVMSVVHSHSPSVVPFSVVPTVPLRSICHMSGFIGEAAPLFEIRDTAGPSSDMLIRSQELGVALAESLGAQAVVLMRGHGSTVVGGSIRQAVFRAVYTEVNAKLQTEALKLGPPVYLSPGEAAAASATNDGQIDRSWNLWRQQVEA